MSLVGWCVEDFRRRLDQRQTFRFMQPPDRHEALDVLQPVAPLVGRGSVIQVKREAALPGSDYVCRDADDRSGLADAETVTDGRACASDCHPSINPRISGFSSGNVANVRPTS